MSRVTYESVKANWARVTEGGSTHSPQEIGQRFATLVAESVGLTDARGVVARRADGFPELRKDRKKTVADYNLKAVTEALLGDRWPQLLRIDTQGDQYAFKQVLREESAAPIGPSFLANVNAWTATIGGLIQAQLLEGYEQAPFEERTLFPTRPVIFWQGGERYVAIIGPSRMAPEVGPGEEAPDARLDGMWVEPGPMKKYMRKILITKETAFTDITGGQVLARAKQVGNELAYRENDLVLNAVVGTTNNWKLGLTQDASATGYNTYGATVPTGLGTTGTLNNDIVNPMLDPFTTWQTSQDYLLQYKHPITGNPMPKAQELKTALIPSSLSWFARYLLGLGTVQLGTQPTAPFPQLPNTSSFPSAWMGGENPFRGTVTQTIESQWLFTKHLTSATAVDPDIPVGLGLSLANSRRWYRLDPAEFACRRAAWEMTQVDLSPSDYVMATQGIIAGQVGSVAVMVQVLNPYAIQRNKVA
jgi:hypothetical protein